MLQDDHLYHDSLNNKVLRINGKERTSAATATRSHSNDMEEVGGVT